MELISKSHKKLIWSIVGGVAIVLIALMIIGSFWDLQIAEAFAVGERGFIYFGFGMGFEVLGFLPAILVNACLFAALSVFVKKKWLKILFHVLVAMHLIGAVYCAIFWTLSNHDMGLRTAIAAPIFVTLGVALSFPLIMLFKRIEPSKLKVLIYILVIGVIMGTIANAAAGIMQIFWGRYRFFEVSQNGLPFTQWFAPFGRSDAAAGHGATSFPSLHASSVTSIIVLVMAGWALAIKKPLKITFAVIAAVLLVCVPLSRMVLGWHYLTDVAFSLILGLVAFVIALLLADLVFGKKFKNFINGNNKVASNKEEVK